MQLVNVPLAGVPNIGVTKVGLLDKTKLPEPVAVGAAPDARKKDERFFDI